MRAIRFESLPEIKTNRFLLRPFKESDLTDLFALRSNPVAMRYIDRPKPTDLTKAEEMYVKFKEGEKNGTLYNWVITEPGMDRMLGFIGFFSFENENYRAEIGYMLFPENFRKGIMQEALEAVVQFGFNRLDLHSITANVNPENTASLGLLEKAKFKKEACFRENYYFDGRFLDSIIYCRLQQD